MTGREREDDVTKRETKQGKADRRQTLVCVQVFVFGEGGGMRN